MEQVYRYRFVVDGREEVDPIVSVHVDELGESSLLEVVNPSSKVGNLSNENPVTPISMTELDVRNRYLRDDVCTIMVMQDECVSNYVLIAGSFEHRACASACYSTQEHRLVI